ncbi:hypothetical protein NIES4072_72380 [Nostoc commune NIES-4072]|uniref:Uncharacterized protein n=2 Tax=Nostoc TaxID=1177 RepID=A0A2R5FXN3_NOSCO|nr:hypothetical protein [Nostoc commune]BBD70000.1 hypothetical protein NIES4070_64110 [Nostoc commune HK-02]GBG23526.1 hypothetical protein NIES4072_72380 [Nostoc commune NIES-4072]
MQYVKSEKNRRSLVSRGLERRIIYTVSIEDMGNQSDNQAIDRQVLSIKELLGTIKYYPAANF